MWYETKRAILEAYGKDWKNVRWLEKAIQRGFVVEQNGMYAFRSELDWVDKSWLQVEISWLKEENNKLRREIKELKEWWNNCKDLLDHLKFFYEMDLARKEAMDKVVKWYYDKNPNDWWENAVEKANKFMGFSENPYENDEIEYVKGIL